METLMEILDPSWSYIIDSQGSAYSYDGIISSFPELLEDSATIIGNSIHMAPIGGGKPVETFTIIF